MMKNLNLGIWLMSIIGVVMWAYQSFKDYELCTPELIGWAGCEIQGIETPIEIIGISLFAISLCSLVFLKNHEAFSSEEE